jgi:short-subunit dehydrogenase
MSKGTALITGASVGLGREFARLFAKDGHDVVLVARSRDKLEALAKELTAQHKVKAHVVDVDLGARDGAQQVFDRVSALGVDVDVLVNNAGFGSSGAFLQLPLDKEIGQVDLNVSALVALSHLFGKGMVEKKTGHILNIASTAGFQPGPFMATYFATKAFVVSFSEALAYELKSTGVTVTCHCPGATATEFASTAGNDKTALFKKGSVASAEEVARHAYRAMHKGHVLSIHGVMNNILMQANRFSPRAVVRSITAGMNSPV